MLSAAVIDRVTAAVDAVADELVTFTSDLIKVPTVNPPGEAYEDCARLIGDRLAACGFEVEYHAAEGRPEHTAAHPRVNVVGLRRGRAPWHSDTPTSRHSKYGPLSRCRNGRGSCIRPHRHP